MLSDEFFRKIVTDSMPTDVKGGQSTILCARSPGPVCGCRIAVLPLSSRNVFPSSETSVSWLSLAARITGGQVNFVSSWSDGSTCSNFCGQGRICSDGDFIVIQPAMALRVTEFRWQALAFVSVTPYRRLSQATIDSTPKLYSFPIETVSVTQLFPEQESSTHPV